MKIQTKSYKSSTFHVYVETTVERRMTVRAIDKEEAIELATRRVNERCKTFMRNKNYKVVEHEIVDTIEVKQ
jgi:hypothetical protein